VHFLMAFELEIKSICVITRYLENSFQSQGNTIVLMSVVLNALDAFQGRAGSAGRVERSQLSPLDFDLYRLKKGAWRTVGIDTRGYCVSESPIGDILPLYLCN
jgi:hypothetical protein